MRLIRGTWWGFWTLLFLVSVSYPAMGQTGNFCVRDFQGGAVCTANDVRIEELIALNVIEDCGAGTIGETEVVFELLVSADGSPDRYDIGLYLALDGGSARDGDSCFHDYLEPPLTATPTLGDKNMDGVPDIENGPWLDNDSDQCGDIGTNTQVFKTLPALRFACVDSNLDGSVDVSVCTSWDNNANTVCNDVSGAFPGTNSKCSCDTVELGIPLVVPNPSLSVSKSPATQSVLSGGTATFTLTVQNTGNQDLSNVVVDDPQCTTLTGPSGDDGDGVLETTETWTYTCEVTNVTSDFTNSVTVTGTPPTGPDVSDSDTADVTVENPSLTVSKTPATQSVLTGTTASFTITVENTGNVDLSSVVVSDPQCDSLTGPAGDTDNDSVLDVAETWTYTCSVNNVTADFTNTATVTATPPTGPDVSDEDSADVTVEDPSLLVSKTPDTQAVLINGTAAFTITVENTGNVDLANPVVNDPQCTTLTGPSGDDGDGVLEVGETWTYSCEVTPVTSGFINTASVTATPPTGPDVSDEDSATVTVDAPSISVDKTPASQTVLVGEPASFTLTVDNTGNVDIVNVAVVDLQCDTLTGPSGDDGDSVLELGETWTYICTVDEVFEAFTNSVTVSGNPIESQQEVSDSDTADVAVVSPLVTAFKSSALSEDNDGSGTLTAGDRILYTIELDNTGLGDALDVLFTDLPDPNTSLVVGTVVASQGTVLRGNTAGDMDVVVELGTLPAGGSATVSFEVEVDDPLADGVSQVVNQGLVSGANFPDVPTDDPRTLPTDDPTVDGIDQPQQAFEIPTLSEWSFLIFVLLLAATALAVMRRRRMAE